MYKKSSLIAVVFCVILAVLISGCSTMVIKLNPKVPLEALQGKRIPYKVSLYMDSQFQEYRFQEHNGAEMSEMDYELGAAAKSLMIETFMRISDGAIIVDKKPPYSPTDKVQATIVIEPHFVAFSENHNAFVRIANYYAAVEFHVTVYDINGNTVLDKNYKGEGNVQGKRTVSPANNYAAPAEVAMSNVIVSLVDDINKLKVQ